MPSTTLRYKSGDDRPPAAVYWRRRFVALLAGIAVLGMVAWAISGALGGSSTGSNAADVGHLSHGHSGRPAPGASKGSSTSTSAMGTQVPGQSAARSPGPGSPVAASSGPGKPGPGAAAASPGGPPSCTPGDVVISLFTTQASYGQGQPAGFDVDVVSTAATTCSFNVGPRYLALVVMAGGRRVWGSADCAPRAGSLLADLARGVPTVLPVSWDLQTSAPGCPATARQAGDGSYTATAADGSITSNPVTFKLS